MSCLTDSLRTGKTKQTTTKQIKKDDFFHAHFLFHFISAYEPIEAVFTVHMTRPVQCCCCSFSSCRCLLVVAVVVVVVVIDDNDDDDDVVVVVVVVVVTH